MFESTWSKDNRLLVDMLIDKDDTEKEYDFGIEKSKDPDSALALRELMSEISEDHNCAGWLVDLEYDLWSMTMNGPTSWGFGYMTWREVHDLIILSRAAGGWWRWNAELRDREFLTIEDWESVFRRRAEQYDAMYKRPELAAGDMVTTAFANKAIYLWDMSPHDPDFINMKTLSERETSSGYSALWDNGSSGVVLDMTGDWVRIVTAAGTTGWVGVWNVRKV